MKIHTKVYDYRISSKTLMLQVKSLRVFINKYSPKLAFRLSFRDFNVSKDGLIDLPLYAVHLIPRFVKAYNEDSQNIYNIL